MTPEELALVIRQAIIAAIDNGSLTLNAEDVPDPVKVERPRNRDHGDWATNIAMQLGKKAGMAPARPHAPRVAGPNHTK